MDDRSKAIEDQAQKHKNAILAGLAAAWSVGHVVQAWGHTAPSSLWSKQQTADWVRTNITFNNTALATALTNLWATGAVLGSDAAEHAYAVAGGSGDAIRIVANFDWSNWSPGNRPAAVIANPVGGFADRLAQRGVTLNGLDDTTVNRIGTVLSNGLADGLTPHVVATDVAGELIDSRTNWAAELTDRLTQIQQDGRRAETIARTEMNQAVADEVVNRYDALGVRQVEWNVIDPCPICDELDGEVRDLGDEFAPGITQPTVHPNCNCFLTPVIDDTTDKFLQAWALKFNENHDETGRFAPSDSGSKNDEIKSRMTEPKKTFDGPVYLEQFDTASKNSEQYLLKYTDKNGKEYNISVSKNDLANTETFDEHGNEVKINTYYEATARDSGIQVGFLQANENKILGIEVSQDYQRRGLATALLESVRSVSPTTISHSSDLTESGAAFANAIKSLKPEMANKIPPTVGVPGSLQMEQALSRLTILPNPTDPTIKNPIKYVETPWEVVTVPTIDPNIWDQARIRVIKIGDLYGTDPYLKRKRVRHHIESMGQALTPYRSYAMVLEHDGQPLIIDGHHRLMSLWLLGLNEAPVWFVKE